MAQSDILLQGKYLTGVSSVVGDTRRQYEDRAKLSQVQTARGLDLLVAIIADGVGSADNGGLAAQLSIDSVISYMQDSEETDIALMISNALKYANYVVYKDVVTRDVDASTTLTVGVFYKDRFYVGNVGDSRAYWIQDSGKVIQLTLDHNYYNIKGGDPKSPQAETLVNAIGIRKDVYADIGLYVKDKERKQAAKIGSQGLPLKVGDTILLCSDGLIKDDLQGERFVREEEIVQALHTEIQPNAAAVKMTGLAEGRYVDDNVSVITVQHTSPERIENVLSKQKRKSATQKLIYAGLGLLVVAGIVTGSLLMNANRKASLQIQTLTNVPSQTALVYTAVASPTATAEIVIEAGSVQAMGIGSYDPKTGYAEYGLEGPEYPQWANLVAGLGMQKILTGQDNMMRDYLGIETFGEVGAMFSVGSRSFGSSSLGNNKLYVYGGSSLTLRNEQGVTEISMTQGAFFVDLVGRSEIAELTLPNHGNASAKIVGGSGLFVIQPETVTMWCLREDCEIEFADQFVRLREGQIRVYRFADNTITEAEAYQPPSERYEEYLLWNNRCNGCLAFEKLPSPTPTPIPVTPTPLPDNGQGPLPTASSIPSLVIVPTRTQSIPTRIPPSATPIPPSATNTPIATMTQIPPTATTAIPPTVTTSVPPTATTSVPPTATAVVPTVFTPAPSANPFLPSKTP